MKKFVQSIVDVRQGEFKVTLLLLANIYLILLTYYFLKPTRDSLFLVKLGAEQLPYVFILTALIIVPIISLYSKASRILKLNYLINYTLLILIICLFGLRYLMVLPYGWVPYIFYTWVSIYGALATSQFWLLANTIYNATQAKRLFALLGLGGIFGAWTGGEATSLMLNVFHISTENLLLFCVGFLTICIFLTTIIWRIKRKEIEQQSRLNKKKDVQKESLWGMYFSIKKSKHLLLIVGIISITMMVATIVDFQFKAISTESFTDAATGEVDKSALTAFLGIFYGRLSLVSIFLQLILAHRFLRVFGVGSVILFLPIGLLLGSIAMFAYIGLLTAILLRGTDGAIKNSIDKTGRELLFLPIPLELKKRTKAFIDMFIDRIARGFAGVLLLLCISVFNYESNPTQAIRLMSLVVIAFLIVWIILALIMRKEYVNTFRTAIARRQINLTEIRQQINESSTIETLIKSLRSDNEKEICYALEMLEGVNNDRLVEPLKKLLNHPSNEVKLKTLRLLKIIDVEPDPSLVKNLLEHYNSDIRVEAMHYLILHSQEESLSLIQGFLNHTDIKIQIITLSCLAEYGNDAQKELINVDLISKFVSNNSENRTEILTLTARALGKLRNQEFSQYIKKLLDDPSSDVVIEAIKSLRYLNDREYVIWLLNALADKRYRYEARLSLASYGEDVVETLSNYLVDESTLWEVQKNIPSVLSLIYDQASIDVLTDVVSKVTSRLKYFVIKALSKLRYNCPDLDFHRKTIDDVLILETKYYYEISQHLILQRKNNTPEGKLLIKALEEKLDENIERIFRLLGLHYPSKDIYNAYHGVASNISSRRAGAVEFLDNILKGDVKKYLFPILDEVSPDRIIRHGRELFGLKLSSENESLVNLMNGNDYWLICLSVFNARNLNSDNIMNSVKQKLNHADPIVRETAEYILKN